MRRHPILVAGITIAFLLGLASAISALVGCATLPSEAQRANIAARIRNQEREAEAPGPRTPAQVVALRAEEAALEATVNSACVGAPVR